MVRRRPHRCIKAKPASPRNRSVQIGCHVKKDPPSPPHNRYARIDGPASPPRLNWREKVVKVELPPAIAKVRRRILHYLGSHDNSLLLRAIVSAEERADMEAAQRATPLRLCQVK